MLYCVCEYQILISFVTVVLTQIAIAVTQDIKDKRS